MQDSILEKAKEMFLERGVKTVTMDDIAREMGISKKTIYTYYSSKEELLQQAVESLFRFVIEKLKEARKQSQNPIQELLEENYILKEVIVFDERKIQVHHELEKYYPKIEKKFLEVRLSEFKNSFVDNLQRGIAQGLYRENLPIDFIVRNYFVSLAAFYRKEYNQLEISQSVKQVCFLQVEYFLRAIVSTKGLEILEELINSKYINQ